MNVFIIKSLILYFTCFCNALKLFERSEFLEKDDNSTKNETSSWNILMQERPNAILVELQNSLLEKLKWIIEEENNTDDRIGPITLATFDSGGLQEITSYNDTFELRQAIMALQATDQQNGIFFPAIHALTELLERGLSHGSVTLVTMSKPSDENFVEALMRTLTESKSKLTVLWAGDETSDDYLLLKDMTRISGGKFKYLHDDSEKFLGPYSDTEHLSESIKFPEDQDESTGKEPTLVSRAADQKVFQKVVVPLIVEVASGTSLESRPGTPTQIQFNVKNNINMPIQIFFTARYNGIIQTVQPTQTVLQPSSTITATVNVHVGVTQNVNAVGTVTLFATALNRVTARSALISMTPQTTPDNYAPKMYHKYEGDCSNYKEPQNCENGHWSLEVTVHDEDSGILKILSEPYGLLFQNEFIAGTRTPVTVYYSATCCQPITHIWAEDLKGNYIKKSFDVFNQNLLAGEIASIVLGILLVLFLVIAIVIAIVLIRRRNQRNLIIPRARSGSR